MRRAQTAILRSLLQLGLQADGSGLVACAPAASCLQGALQTSARQAEFTRQCNSTSQQAERSARLEALVALAGGLAAYSYLQPQAEALVAEPAPAGAERIAGQAAAPAKDVYALPTAGLRGVPKEVILYQYDVCPFCCKVKAVLDYYRIPYRCVEVGPLMKAELKWSDYKKVPVAMLDGEVLVDSSTIISRIAAEKDAEAVSAAAAQPTTRNWFGGRKAATQPASPTVPHTGAKLLCPIVKLAGTLREEDRWRRWVDAKLVRVLTINIYRNRTESFQTFDYITKAGNFNFIEREVGRVFGAATMWLVSGRLRKKYGIQGEAREELYACADAWLAALSGRPFLGGDKPNLADLSVFGAIRSVTGTDTFMDLLHNTPIAGWYERMMAAVGDSSRLPDYHPAA